MKSGVFSVSCNIGVNVLHNTNGFPLSYLSLKTDVFTLFGNFNRNITTDTKYDVLSASRYTLQVLIFIAIKT